MVWCYKIAIYILLMLRLLGYILLYSFCLATTFTFFLNPDQLFWTMDSCSFVALWAFGTFLFFLIERLEKALDICLYFLVLTTF